MDFYSMMLAKKLNKESGGDVTIESLVVTENGNYSKTGKAYSPVVVNVPLPENGYLLESASGQVVNITDAAPLYLQECKAEVEAVQDLHGYDHPWVGGAGKNKLDIEGWLNSVGATYTKSGNTYTISAAIALFSTPFTFSDTDVAISASASSYVAGTATFIRMQLLDSNNNVVDELTANQSYQKREGVVASKVRFDWSVGGTFTITEPQIELGSTATSFAPYSNICPISGRTEEVITQKDNPTNPTVTKTYTIQLGDTIYGGELDVLTGKLRVDTAIVNPTTVSSKTSSTTNDGYYLGALNDAKAPSSISELCGIICNEFEEKSTEYLYRNDAYGVTINTNKELYIFLGKGNVTTISQANTWLSNNPLQVVYPLATPITIQLTPQQIRLLEGTNKLSCNTGDLNIEYLGKGVN